MFPLRDDVLSSRFPLVTLLLIAANTAIYGLELRAGPGFEELVTRWGVVPERLLEAAATEWITVFTSMFLHGDLLHLLGNMWFLWIFGDNIEDRLGRLGFAGFYLACGAVAAMSQVALSPDSSLPMVGASGAIAGVLGSYLRLFPRARVLTLIPIFVFVQFVELPAVIFLGLWLATQIISSIVGVSGVAWWAHIFGFVAGLVFSFAVRRTRPRARPRGRVLRYRR